LYAKKALEVEYSQPGPPERILPESLKGMEGMEETEKRLEEVEQEFEQAVEELKRDFKKTVDQLKKEQRT
jgi:hypothetical protein